MICKRASWRVSIIMSRIIFQISPVIWNIGKTIDKSPKEGIGIWGFVTPCTEPPNSTTIFPFSAIPLISSTIATILAISKFIPKVRHSRASFTSALMPKWRMNAPAGLLSSTAAIGPSSKACSILPKTSGETSSLFFSCPSKTAS